jgi:hypothetical protein
VAEMFWKDFQVNGKHSTVVLACICRIIIKPFPVRLDFEASNDGLPGFRTNEIDELGCIGLPGRCSVWQAKGVVGIDENGIPTEQD